MKKPALFLFAFLFSGFLQAQVATHMYTSGNLIYDVCGQPITFRGMNHAPFDWGWNSSYDVFDEIKQTGANAIRIPWYSNSVQGGGGPLYDDLQWLDSAITRCARNHMIPVMDLHDETCNNSIPALLAMTAFYKQPAMLTIIDKHKAYLIINFANEAIYADWGGSATTYRDAFYQVIDSLRSYNIHVPIMIDAPDCGTTSDNFMTVGNQLKMHDPDTNIIFSAHAYWYLYAANMDSVTVRGKLENLEGTGLPFILGEIANRQSDGVDECFYTLNYVPLLRMCQEKDLGWLAWSWDNDVCVPRMMSSNGNFSALTSYGDDLVNNAEYGMSNATRSGYLVNNFSCTGTGVDNEVLSLAVSVSRLYGNIFVLNQSDEEITMEVFDVVGRKWIQKNIQPNAQEVFSDPFTGIKLIRFTQDHLVKTVKIY